MSCLTEGLTDKLTPWRCISWMHAMSKMSVMIDRMAHCLSERSLLSISSLGEGEGGQNALSAHGHILDATFPPPSLLGWVMSWVVVGGAHVTPCDIRLTQCCHRRPCALSWTLGASNEGLQLLSQACWHWMMCLFIMSDRCHVRHALSPCTVSHAFLFFSRNNAVDQSRKALAWGRSDGVMSKTV